LISAFHPTIIRQLAKIILFEPLGAAYSADVSDTPAIETAKPQLSLII
jgi:hypothetical protein